MLTWRGRHASGIDGVVRSNDEDKDEDDNDGLMGGV
jgi:hypothetical protein